MKDELISKLTDIFSEEVVDAVVIEEMKEMHSQLFDDLNTDHNEYDAKLLDAVEVILKYYLSGSEYKSWCME